MALAPYSLSTSRPRTDELWNAQFSNKVAFTGVRHVLNIQVDALLGLVDDAATIRLWKLFTHCAGSIAHGRRLENLSWRTWSAQQAQPSTQSGKHHRSLHSSSSFDSTALTSVTDSESSRCDSDLPRRPSDATASDASLSSPKPPQDHQISSHSQPRIYDGFSPRTRNESSSSTASHESRRPIFRHFNSSSTHSGPHFSSSASHSPPLAFLIKKVILTPPTESSQLDSLFSRHQDQTCHPHSFEDSSTTALAQLPSYSTFSPASTSSSDHHRLRGGAGGFDTPLSSEGRSASGTSTIVPTTPNSSSHASTASATLHLPLYPRQSESTSNWGVHSTQSEALVSSIPSPNASLYATSTSGDNIETIEGTETEQELREPVSVALQQRDLARDLQRCQVLPDTTGAPPNSSILVSNSSPPLISQSSTHTAPVFPTVVVLQSTPKPTPPDTPARCHSPPTHSHLHPFSALIPPPPVSDITEGQGQEFVQRRATTSSTTSENLPSSESSTSAPLPFLQRSSNIIGANQPLRGILLHRSETPLSSSSSAAVQFLTPAVAAGSESGIWSTFGKLNSDHRTGTSAFNPSIKPKSDPSTTKGETSVSELNGVSPLPSQRMFFLHRDSTSFSPDSNSRSGSHSRSPGSNHEQGRTTSRSPDRTAATHSSSHSRSPERFPINRGHLPSSQTRSNYQADLSADARSTTGQHSLPHDRVQSLRTEAALEAIDGGGRGEVAKSARLPDSRASGPTPPTNQQQQPMYPVSSPPSRVEMPLQFKEGSAESSHQLPSPSTESSHTTSSRYRVSMRSKRAANRVNVGRALERPSSRNSGGRRRYDASTESRESGVKRGKGIGSIEANTGSMSAADSVSTSSSSKLVMSRPQRLHATARMDAAPERTLPTAGVTTGLAGQHERSQADPRPSLQTQRAGNRVLSPLAALPDPKLENFQRQVMETTRQNGGRRIALESDSDDDDDVTSDSDEDEDGDEMKKLPDEKGSVMATDDDGGSWSDESDEDKVTLPQAGRNQARGQVQPPVRKDSGEHHVGSAGSGRLPARHPHAHGHTKPHAPLPHVRSKAKITHQAQGTSPPPTRNPVARTNSSGNMTQHRRSNSSGEGPLAQAAREAQRQREMFTPLPRETYSSTNLVREKSLTSLSRGGRPSNLTLLLNPDPRLFPQEHPYRKQTQLPDPKLSRSMEELHARMTNANSTNNSSSNLRSAGARGSRPGIGLGFGGLRMTSAIDVTRSRRSTPMAPAEQVAPPTPIIQPPTPAVAPESPAPTGSHSNRTHRRLSSLDVSKSPPAPSKLRPSKSSVAVPMVLGVTASSAPRDSDRADIMEMSLRQMGPRHPRVSRFQQGAPAAAPALDQQPVEDHSKGGTSSRGYRLGGAPMGVDYSDSEDDEDVSPQTKT
ncbi:hypothetical protein FRC19_008632, partial [Serendipita sp. 401]